MCERRREEAAIAATLFSHSLLMLLMSPFFSAAAKSLPSNRSVAANARSVILALSRTLYTCTLTIISTLTI